MDGSNEHLKKNSKWQPVKEVISLNFGSMAS
jgi:hypothetical protein